MYLVYTCLYHNFSVCTTICHVYTVSSMYIRRIRALPNKSVTESSEALSKASVARAAFFETIRLYTTGWLKPNSVVAIRLPDSHNRINICKKEISQNVRRAFACSQLWCRLPQGEYGSEHRWNLNARS